MPQNTPKSEPKLPPFYISLAGLRELRAKAKSARAVLAAKAERTRERVLEIRSQSAKYSAQYLLEQESALRRETAERMGEAYGAALAARDEAVAQRPYYEPLAVIRRAPFKSVDGKGLDAAAQAPASIAAHTRVSLLADVELVVDAEFAYARRDPAMLAVIRGEVLRRGTMKMPQAARIQQIVDAAARELPEYTEAQELISAIEKDAHDAQLLVHEAKHGRDDSIGKINAGFRAREEARRAGGE